VSLEDCKSRQKQARLILTTMLWKPEEQTPCLVHLMLMSFASSTSSQDERAFTLASGTIQEKASDTAPFINL
jgi:hypothetical protein